MILFGARTGCEQRRPPIRPEATNSTDEAASPGESAVIDACATARSVSTQLPRHGGPGTDEGPAREVSSTAFPQRPAWVATSGRAESPRHLALLPISERCRGRFHRPAGHAEAEADPGLAAVHLWDAWGKCEPWLQAVLHAPARYCSSCTSDSTLRWVPCPPNSVSSGSSARLSLRSVAGFGLRAHMSFYIPPFQSAEKVLRPHFLDVTALHLRGSGTLNP